MEFSVFPLSKYEDRLTLWKIEFVIFPIWKSRHRFSYMKHAICYMKIWKKVFLLKYWMFYFTLIKIYVHILHMIYGILCVYLWKILTFFSSSFLWSLCRWTHPLTFNTIYYSKIYISSFVLPMSSRFILKWLLNTLTSRYLISCLKTQSYCVNTLAKPISHKESSISIRDTTVYTVFSCKI